MRGLQNLPDIKGKYALLRKTQMHFALDESFLKVVTQHVEVVTMCSCCIHLTVMGIKVSRNILLFSPLFCRKVVSIKVDVISDLLPSLATLPLLSCVILLWRTKWAFSIADKPRWEHEGCYTVTLGKNSKVNTKEILRWMVCQMFHGQRFLHGAPAM